MTDVAKESALAGACDRICGVHAKYHKDRCPLYKANCEAMAASRQLDDR